MTMNVSEMTVLLPGLDYGRTLLTSTGFSAWNSGCGCVSPIALQGLLVVVLLVYDHVHRCSPRSYPGWLFSGRWSAGAVSRVMFICHPMILLLLMVLLATCRPTPLLMSCSAGCPDVCLPSKGAGPPAPYSFCLHTLACYVSSRAGMMRGT